MTLVSIVKMFVRLVPICWFSYKEMYYTHREREGERERGREGERGTMHCRNITCTRSFERGLTTAEGQKLECFK
jgi:hypothetical protein